MKSAADLPGQARRWCLGSRLVLLAWLGGGHADFRLARKPFSLSESRLLGLRPRQKWGHSITWARAAVAGMGAEALALLEIRTASRRQGPSDVLIQLTLSFQRGAAQGQVGMGQLREPEHLLKHLGQGQGDLALYFPLFICSILFSVLGNIRSPSAEWSLLL